MIMHGLGRFGEDWSSEELWRTQTNPTPSPVATVAPTVPTYPNNYVEVPVGYTTETWGSKLQAEEDSGPGFFDTIARLFATPAGYQTQATPTMAAPAKPFFQTPFGLVVGVGGAVAVLGMTYFLFKPASGPVAIYDGYNGRKRRRKRARR